MLIRREVVEAAKEGGWNPFGEPYQIERVEHDTIYFGNKEFSHFFGVNDLATDKCFWQALAISFNWTRPFIAISYGIAASRSTASSNSGSTKRDAFSRFLSKTAIRMPFGKSICGGGWPEKRSCVV
jgi:hypothetical protein